MYKNCSFLTLKMNIDQLINQLYTSVVCSDNIETMCFFAIKIFRLIVINRMTQKYSYMMRKIFNEVKSDPRYICLDKTEQGRLFGIWLGHPTLRVLE